MDLQLAFEFLLLNFDLSGNLMPLSITARHSYNSERSIKPGRTKFV